MQRVCQNMRGNFNELNLQNIWTSMNINWTDYSMGEGATTFRGTK